MREKIKKDSSDKWGFDYPKVTFLRKSTLSEHCDDKSIPDVIDEIVITAKIVRWVKAPDTAAGIIKRSIAKVELTLTVENETRMRLEKCYLNDRAVSLGDHFSRKKCEELLSFGKKFLPSNWKDVLLKELEKKHRN